MWSQNTSKNIIKINQMPIHYNMWKARIEKNIFGGPVTSLWLTEFGPWAAYCPTSAL